MTNIGNTNRAQIISDLTEILAILTKYEHAYQDLKTAEAQYRESEPAVIEDIPEPDEIPLPDGPDLILAEGKGPVVLFYLLTIICSLPVISHYPFGQNILDDKLVVMELVVLACCVLLLILSIISMLREKKQISKLNAEAEAEFEGQCRLILEENERLRNQYLFRRQQAIEIAEAQQKVNDEQAKRDNAMVKLQADKARNSMNLMRKRYMQKFAHYLPEQYANIASVKELLRIFTVDENISSLQEAIDILERNSK